MEEEHTKEPSHNNPEEAANYVKAVNMLLQSFVSDIHGFNCYAQQDAYKNFLHTLSQLLSKLDSNFFNLLFTNIMYSLKNILLFYVKYFSDKISTLIYHTN